MTRFSPPTKKKKSLWFLSSGLAETQHRDGQLRPHTGAWSWSCPHGAAQNVGGSIAPHPYVTPPAAPGAWPGGVWGGLGYRGRAGRHRVTQVSPLVSETSHGSQPSPGASPDGLSCPFVGLKPVGRGRFFCSFGGEGFPPRRWSDIVVLRQKLVAGANWARPLSEAGGCLGADPVSFVAQGGQTTLAGLSPPWEQPSSLAGECFSSVFSRRSPLPLLSRRFYPALTSSFHEFPLGKRSLSRSKGPTGIYGFWPSPGWMDQRGWLASKPVIKFRGDPGMFAAGDKGPGGLLRAPSSTHGLSPTPRHGHWHSAGGLEGVAP
ncbi:uncharacterized protein LOC113490515 [Athene cunicularia]|uniref:uncharacterized protein LOC113490515 n=1 Tax=Athene cunicularia TaxID=194338 RepID=UPI000EF64383|nr:uncharacterized protein LOC113490515 [Athene cunicularia]